MKNTTNLLLIVLISFSTIQCSGLLGEEEALLPINAVSVDDNNLIVKEATLKLDSGTVISFWSEMDMEYEGDMGFEFRIEVIKGDEQVAYIEIDPTDKNISLNEVFTEINNKTNWRFTWKNGEYNIPETGTYTFKSILIASPNESLKLEKAELILKK